MVRIVLTDVEEARKKAFFKKAMEWFKQKTGRDFQPEGVTGSSPIHFEITKDGIGTYITLVAFGGQLREEITDEDTVG